METPVHQKCVTFVRINDQLATSLLTQEHITVLMRFNEWLGTSVAFVNENYD